MDGLYRAMGHSARNAAQPQYCDACFTGEYPTRLTDVTDGTMATQLPLLQIA
jgi:amidophosphoribosyltransferase